MPRKARPKKIVLLKIELAERLGIPLEEIIGRDEAAVLLGTHPKSMSNNPEMFPAFYLGDLGRNGVALYTRRSVEAFVGLKRPVTGKLEWPDEIDPREAEIASWKRAGLTDEDHIALLMGERSE